MAVLPARRRTTATPATASASTAQSRWPGVCLLCLDLGSVIDKKCVQVERIGQYVVADVVPAEANMVQAYRVPSLKSHLNALQVSIHADINTCDGALHDGAILELDRNRLIGKFHQKANELHPAWLSMYNPRSVCLCSRVPGKP